ncbi:mitochondrial 37S ribosomal uS14m domain-containing protein, partial [Apiospora kogelbergensis]
PELLIRGTTATTAIMSMFKAKKLDIGSFVNTHVIRDHTKRKTYALFEPERQALRHIIRNTTLPPRTRAEAQLQLTQMHCYTRPTQIRGRCLMGGKGRGIFRDFKLSRYNFRMQALEGNLPGVRKASW